MSVLTKKIIQFGQRQHDKWEKLPISLKMKILRAIIAIGFANLLYSLFGLYTIISMALCFAGVGLLLKLRVDTILDRGLLSFTSKKLQRVLIERSIFDFLCDLWFMPKIGLYIKAIFRPFLVTINPEDAVHQFEELPDSVQKFFLQKGIVNVLPSKLRGIMIPKAFRNAIPENSENNNEHEAEMPSYKITTSQSSVNLRGIIKAPQGERLKESEIITTKGKSSFLSTDEEPKNIIHEKIREVKSWLSLPNTENSWEIERSRSIGRVSKQKRKIAEQRLPKKMERSYIFDPVDGNGYRSEIIASNHTIPSKKTAWQQNPSYRWDKLDYYLKVSQEKSKQGKNTRKSAPLRGPLQMIDKIRGFMQMSKKGFLTHLDEKKLFRVFCLSTIGLLLQFALSKKSRAWLYNTLHILIYIAGFALSSGTLILYALKLKKKSEEEHRRLRGSDQRAEEGDEEHQIIN